MRHLDRYPALDERLEQRRGVLDRDAEATGERGGRDDGCGCHDVDRNDGARIPSPVPHRGACSEPLSFHEAQQLGAGLRLLGQRRQEAVQASISRGVSLSSVFAPVSSGQARCSNPHRCQ
jgi:hypothetical protein